MKSPISSIAFLGPKGTFAHLAATERYGQKCRLVPQPSVKDVFEYVAADKSRCGVVPIENSSGGNIYETVDRLVDASYDLFIQESLSINVKLALLAKDAKNIKVIYSHFAPLHHCETWLNKHFPNAEKRETSSTTTAAIAATEEKGAAAISTRLAGDLYKLKVLQFPIDQDVPNVTQFLVLGHQRPDPQTGTRTSMVVELPNSTGALHQFLGPFAKEKINLSRILSRPIPACPGSHVFLIDADTKENDAALQRAWRKAAKVAVKMRSVGSYPVREKYESS